MMKLVTYRSFPDETRWVQFHFAVSKKKYWYDKNIQPAADFITYLVPPEYRFFDRGTASWSVVITFWPTIQQHLISSGFTVKLEDETRASRRDTQREIASISMLSLLLLFLIQIFEVAHRFFGVSRLGLPNRSFTFLVLCVIAFVSLRFHNYIHAALLTLAGIGLGPFGVGHISSWWLWQILVWSSLLVASVIVTVNFYSASTERELDYWWAKLPYRPKGE